MCLTGTPDQMHKVWSEKQKQRFQLHKLKVNAFPSAFKGNIMYLTFTIEHLLCAISCHRIFVEGTLGITKYKCTKINTTKTRMSISVSVVFPGPTTVNIINTTTVGTELLLSELFNECLL